MMLVFVLRENDDYDHSYNVAVSVYSTLSDAVAECNRRNVESEDSNLSYWYSVKEFEVL
jgi:hypothetical protein